MNSQFLIEYSLWQFKIDEMLMKGDVDLNVSAQHIPDNSSSSKYKSSFITTRNSVKLVLPLKYLSSSWGSLEMPLINCKIELSLKWYENCILSSAGTVATFAIADTKLYVPVVTLKTKDNAKFSELLSKEFERSVYWNKYKAVLTDYIENSYIRKRLDASFQGINKLFVLPYAHGNNVTKKNSSGKYFLPRLKIKHCNIEIDGRNVYDKSINDSIKQYGEIRKTSIGQGDDYTTGCLLDFAYFEKKIQINCCCFE